MAFCNYTHMHGPIVNVTHVSLLLMPLHLLSSPQTFSFFSLLFSFSGLTLHCSFFLLLLLLLFSSSFTFSGLRYTVLSFLFSFFFLDYAALFFLSSSHFFFLLLSLSPVYAALFFRSSFPFFFLLFIFLVLHHRTHKWCHCWRSSQVQSSSFFLFFFFLFAFLISDS